MKPREFAFCGLFGAAALLLPVLFHVTHLGRVFMPMYLPLMALAFYVRPLPAALTALIIPLLSGAVTGMPPFYPPVAPVMSIEISIMAFLAGTVIKLRPLTPPFLVLLPVLVLGRFIGVALVYLAALFMKLPAAYMAGLSFCIRMARHHSMLGAIPLLVRLSKPAPIKMKG